MPDITNQPFNPDYSRELDIESLISAPLVAVSKANAIMAQGQTRFLLEYCFNKNGDNYEPVQIQMAVNKSVIAPGKPAIPASVGVPEVPAVPQSIEIVTNYFSLPLLTIIPLNSLTIQKVSIGFHLDISSATTAPTKTANESNNTISNKTAQLYGKITQDPADANKNANQNGSQHSKIKVDLDAATLPLPKGVLTIIDLYTKSILAVPTDKAEHP
jgi:hypothetical protein